MELSFPQALSPKKLDYFVIIVVLHGVCNMLQHAVSRNRIVPNHL